jgi:hypothetical protein
MSSRQDPPRLRDMGTELPDGLAAALTSDPAEFPQATEMSDLANRLAPLLETATAAAAAAIPMGLLAPKAPLSFAGTLKLVALKWGHTVILPMAIGAASGGVAWEAREYLSSKQEHPTTVAKAAPVRQAPAVSRGKRAKRELVAKTEVEPAEESVAKAVESVAPSARAVPAPGLAQAPSTAASSVLDVPPPLVVNDNVSEIELIDRAQRALAQQPAVAREWIGEHMKRFPDGTFTQERETIAIEAFVGEGRLVEAKARAAQFRARFPESAYLRRIDAVLRNPKAR